MKNEEKIQEKSTSRPPFFKKKFLKGYSKIHELQYISIGLASPEKIQSWAEKELPNGKIFGEVTNANTFHYKTFQPTKGGLFCERIFGPLKDFECACGKRQKPTALESKKILEHKQTTRYFCSNCDVEYTWSILRRYQLGYIKLHAPVTHLWYLKASPSYFSIFFDMKRKDLEAVVYCTESFTLENVWKYKDQKMNFSNSISDLSRFFQKSQNFNERKKKIEKYFQNEKQKNIYERQKVLQNFKTESKKNWKGKENFFKSFERKKDSSFDFETIQEEKKENFSPFQLKVFEKVQKEKKEIFLSFLFKKIFQKRIEKMYQTIFFKTCSNESFLRTNKKNGKLEYFANLFSFFSGKNQKKSLLFLFLQSQKNEKNIVDEKTKKFFLFFFLLKIANFFLFPSFSLKTKNNEFFSKTNLLFFVCFLCFLKKQKTEVDSFFLFSKKNRNFQAKKKKKSLFLKKKFEIPSVKNSVFAFDFLLLDENLIQKENFSKKQQSLENLFFFFEFFLFLQNKKNQRKKRKIKKKTFLSNMQEEFQMKRISQKKKKNLKKVFQSAFLLGSFEKKIEFIDENENDFFQFEKLFQFQTSFDFSKKLFLKIQKNKNENSVLQNPVLTLPYNFLWKNDSDWKYFVYSNSLFFSEFEDIPRDGFQNTSKNFFSWEMEQKKKTFDFVDSENREKKRGNDFQSFLSFHQSTKHTQVGAGILEKLFLQYTQLELKKMIKQHQILLPKINQLLRLSKQNFTFSKKESFKIQKYLEKREHIVRRFQFLRKFYQKKSNPTSMILKNLPVLPPDLRPILKLQNQIAASDLNRFYQRILYRNERLQKFSKDSSISQSFELKYAQRLLQEAVDNLIQNGKGGVKAETNSRGIPLKSLSEILKGKEGRFRQYLLGKRVDYSGRSVIVVGPKLRFHECGLPKEMAFELFLPFLIQQILQFNLAKTVIGAKNLLKKDETFAFHLLKKVMKKSPVLLNRAPTLHRLGFQAFLPKLVEGRAILLHPMVCPGFNADFDGDQMAVHLPLTVEARTEAWKFMLSTNNFLNSATGDPVLLPTQDMVLGCYYLTSDFQSKSAAFEILNALRKHKKTKFFQFQKRNKNFFFFSNLKDVFSAYQRKEISLHSSIWIRWNGFVDFGNDFTKPIEIQVQKNGNCQQIHPKRTILTNKKNEIFSKFIRTTPGRILMNSLIQEFQNS